MTLYESFVHDVQSRPERHNKFVKQAVTRHLEDLKKDWRFEFRPERADRVINIVKLFRHTSGSFGGKLFDLQPFQGFILAMLFGWVDKTTGLRRFKKAYIEMARKGGKSEFAAAIEMVMAFFDGEHAPQVYTAATKSDQAGYVYNAVSSMCRMLSKDSKTFDEMCRIMQYEIKELNTGGYITKMTSDSKTEDGANPHCAVVDEYHAHKDDSLVKVIETGIGSRDQPLLIIITTAGFDKQSACFAFRNVVTGILAGQVDNDSLFGILFTLDDEDDWNNEEVWIKANPNLGNTPRLDNFRALYQSAITEGSTAEVEFKTKNLNIWVDAAKTWITDADWMNCATGSVIGMKVIIGLDLSSRVDLTAVTWFYPDSLTFVNRYYCPEDKVMLGRRSDGVDYRPWVESGILTATPGNVIDYEYIIRDILSGLEGQTVDMVAYDPYNADLIIPKFTEVGLNCVGVRQGFLTLSPATKRLETMVLGREIGHDGDPVTRWMMSNVTLEMDAAGNIKPSKSKSTNKIDGVASLVTALAGYIALYGSSTGEYSLDDVKKLFE